MERDKKHWEHEMERRGKALEEATARVKRDSEEMDRMREKVKELEAEIVEREACEAQVQEYVKQLLMEKQSM